MRTGGKRSGQVGNAVIVVGVALFLLAGVWSFTGVFSLTNVTSQDEFGFQTNPGTTCFMQVGSGMTLYGETVTIKNLGVATEDEGSTELANPNEAFAKIVYGGETRLVYANDGISEYVVNGLRFEIIERQAERVVRGIYCGQYRYPSNHIENIVWSVTLDVPRDQITVDVGEIVVEDVAPGVKSLTADITVNNGFGAIKTDRLYAAAWGKDITLDAGIIEKGATTYTVQIQSDWYDPANFLFRETIEDELTIHFENPEVPQSMVSGRPDRNGNYMTWESFAPGGTAGTEPDPCNVQYLRSIGKNSRDCVDTTGDDHPGNTQNWLLPLNDIQSVPVVFSTVVTYCGENAAYVNGECVVDEELHLRGDVCPLLEDYQIVSQDFPAGATITTGELQPDPLFFCTKHPALVVDAAGRQTRFITEPYSKLVDGEAVTVPDGQTWRLYWTTDTSNLETSIICDDGTYNKETGKCEVTPGIIHVCGEDAVWAPEQGACIVTPETKTVCEKGRHAVDIGKCVYEPPVKNTCDRGYFDESRGLCLAEGTVKVVCPAEAELENGVCKVTPRIVKQRPLELLRLAIGNVVDAAVGGVLGFFTGLFSQ